MLKLSGTSAPLLILVLSFSPLTFAQQTVINNYPNQQSAQQTNQYQQQGNSGACGPTADNSPNNMPPGTYKVMNNDGSSSTVYTTGDKKPYIVENNCNAPPVIQPYVYPNMPQNGSPTAATSSSTTQTR